MSDQASNALSKFVQKLRFDAAGVAASKDGIDAPLLAAVEIGALAPIGTILTGTFNRIANVVYAF